MSIKYLQTSFSGVPKNGVNRIQVVTDSSRKFCTGFALVFDQSNDANAKYLIGLVSNGKQIINRCPIEIFSKDLKKIKKDEMFFPIDASANGNVLYLELERIASNTPTTETIKIDSIIQLSDIQTPKDEILIIQYEQIKIS